MKAAVCTAGVIEPGEWPEPAPGPGELLLQVRGCGLCGSDILEVAARVRDGGTLHHFADGAGESLPLPLATLDRRELTVGATDSSSPAELAEAFDLLAQGRVRDDGLISHRLPLGRLGEAVEPMRRHEAGKVYVTP